MGDVYQAAGAVLTRLEEKKDSTLKAACLQSPFKGKKMLTALVSQTVRYGAVIEALLEVRKRHTGPDHHRYTHETRTHTSESSDPMDGRAMESRGCTSVLQSCTLKRTQ